MVCTACGINVASSGKEWDGGVPYCTTCYRKETLRRMRLTPSTGALVERGGVLGEKHVASQRGDINGVLGEIGEELEVRGGGG